MGLEEIIPAIFLIAVLILVLPEFFSVVYKNRINNRKKSKSVEIVKNRRRFLSDKNRKKS